MPKLNKDENGINTYNLDAVFEIQPEIDYLSNHFNTFIYKDPKDLFLGIADYIRHIVENDDLKFIKKEYDAEHNEAIKVVEKAKATLEKTLDELISSLDYAIYDYQIDNERIDNSLDKFKQLRDASQIDIEELVRLAKEVLETFVMEGFYKPIIDFVELDDKMINIADFEISKQHNEYKDAKDIYKEQFETETWAYWQTAFEVYMLAYKFRERIKELINKNDVVSETAFREKYDFYKLTREGKDVDANPFKINKYEYKFEKLHNDIMNTLVKLTRVTQKDIDFNKQLMESLKPQMQMLNKAMKDATNFYKFSQPVSLPGIYDDKRQPLQPNKLVRSDGNDTFSAEASEVPISDAAEVGRIVLSKIKEGWEPEKIKKIPRGYVECFKKGKLGYIKYHDGKESKIGSATAIPYKGLKILTDPDFGIGYRLDAFFDKLYETKAPEKLKGYSNNKHNRMVQLIENSFIKKLQKENKLLGKMRVHLDNQKDIIFLEKL